MAVDVLIRIEYEDPTSLMSAIFEAQTDYSRRPFIWFVGTQERFPKRERMEFLARVLRNDQNLINVATAGYFFRRESGQQYTCLNTEAFLNWWETNKSKIE